PAGTPRAVVDSYPAALTKVMADKELIEKFAGLGVVARSGSQADFRSFLAAETAKYAKLVADNNIQAD
ncbi:MAG: tripartite tricarboxylate transporter substrate binding protein, partial [Rubrivivax sp.]